MDRQDETLAQPELGNAKVDERRRKALARLGIAVAAAYSAPTLLKIEKPARAVIIISTCPPGGPNPGGPPGPPAPPGCP